MCGEACLAGPAFMNDGLGPRFGLAPIVYGPKAVLGAKPMFL